MADAWTDIKAHFHDLYVLGTIHGLLEWDQQTYMPPRADDIRGKQAALLSGLYHERITDPRVGDWLAEIAQTGADDPVQCAAVRNLGRKHARAVRLPTRLVRELSEATTKGFRAWMQAREQDAFAPFAPALETLIELNREAIGYLGDAEHPYDHLLAEYDPGSTVAELEPMFERLASELGPLVSAIAEWRGPPPLDLEVDRDGLERVNRKVMAALGFDIERGRLDEAQHPFTCGLSPLDVRLTTHYYTDDLLGTLGGTIHETGHGLYEQGLPYELFGTGAGDAAGMGLHESQSRFWENNIGRSRQFCRWLLGVLKQEWPQLALSADQLYAACNRVEPTFIRVKADEVTYNLHIIVRFQLELALITGQLPVAELPLAWDDAYERVLGIRPPDLRQGVLQDVHWSSGLFGYFPSYTIGNLYAASFIRKLQADLPDLWPSVEAGEFGGILAWLRTNIHERGHLLDAPEIFRATCPDADPVADLMSHFRVRHGSIYGIGA